MCCAILFAGIMEVPIIGKAKNLYSKAYKVYLEVKD